MNESFIERLDKYMEYAGLNDNKVTVQAGITTGLINSARKRGKSLSGDNIGKILYTYKDLNARWLLTGEGDMLVSEFGTDNSDLIKKLNIANEKNKELKEDYRQALIELGQYKERLEKHESSAKTDEAV